MDITRKYDPAAAGIWSFTLVELLVVLAIIAILTTMVFPSLHKAREKARERICANNLKQIGTAAFSYSDENSGCVLPGDLGDIGGYRNWINYMYGNMMRRQEIFQCPSFQEDNEYFDPYGGNSVVDITKASYIMNTIQGGNWGGALEVVDAEIDEIGSSGWCNNAANPLKIQQVRKPEAVIHVLDFIKKPDNYGGTANAWSSDANSLKSWLETDHGPYPIISGTECRDAGNHHSLGFNTVMGDVHVELIKTSEPLAWAAVVSYK